MAYQKLGGLRSICAVRVQYAIQSDTLEEAGRGRLNVRCRCLTMRQFLIPPNWLE
jgi:hypothetical protein